MATSLTRPNDRVLPFHMVHPVFYVPEMFIWLMAVLKKADIRIDIFEDVAPKENQKKSL